MNRFNPREMSINRIYSGITRRIKDIPDSVAWNLGLNGARKNKDNILTFHNKHAGERCFILANGPSLAKVDLSLLKNEITFGMNRIYIAFTENFPSTTYYSCIDEIALINFHQDIKDIKAIKFLNWKKRNLFEECQHTSVLYLRDRLNFKDDFSFDLTKPISSGATVTYVSMQLAHYMGFKEVILLGLDHNYVGNLKPFEFQTRKSDTDENHFAPNYLPMGYKWGLPDVRRVEIAYKMAKLNFEISKRNIIDATDGGHCTIFPKERLENIL